MLSNERTKQILDDPAITDEEIELVRDEARAWAELAFQQWIEERLTAKNPADHINKSGEEQVESPPNNLKSQ